MVIESIPSVWLRQEDRDHPKVDRLRRSVNAVAATERDVTRPWLVWSQGLSRAWLFEMLEIGAQILILPPPPEGGFAGLPAARVVPAPEVELSLDNHTYQVGASSGVDPTPAWQERGLFVGRKTAWLISHEPFVGAGRAWLCTAELLVAGPNTRPREARRLTVDLTVLLTKLCKQKVAPPVTITSGQQPQIGATAEEAPYLLAMLGLQAPVDAVSAAQFLHRRVGVEPDMDLLERILSRPEVQADLKNRVGNRQKLAKVVDDFGLRSFRLEIEETAT
jgi:hypothetical protein